jgi:hypothetical protein
MDNVARTGVKRSLRYSVINNATAAKIAINKRKLIDEPVANKSLITKTCEN